MHIKSSYQIPPDQGFQVPYFELRELQGIMQTFLSQISFLPLPIKLDIKYIYIYHSYPILISDSSRSRLPGSLLQTQGTSRYYATFLSRIWFLPLPIKSDIKYISFISNPHIRFSQIKAFGFTTSNSGNFKVVCNISLTNFIPVAFNYIRHQIYIIHFKVSYQIPPDQGIPRSLLQTHGTSRYYATFLSQIFIPVAF